MFDDNGVEWEWCPTCRAQREVIDRHTEVSLRSGYMWRTTIEEEFTVTDYACGHSKQGATGHSTAYRDPGA